MMESFLDQDRKTMVDLPKKIAEITPAFLSQILNADIATVTHAPVPAQGAISTTTRLDLDYLAETSGPASIFAKCSSSIEDVRQMAKKNGMYRREVMFYQKLVEDSQIPTPTCYFANWDRTNGDFLLLLEDMSNSRVGNFYTSSLKDVEQVIEHLPHFHAHWWNQQRLDQQRWLFPLDHPAAIESLWSAFTAALPVAKQRFPTEFDGALGTIADAISEHYPKIAAHYAMRPATLVHSDLHLQQIFFPDSKGGRFAICDWQTVGRGFMGQDLARIIVTSLDRTLRRTAERSLVESYHKRLIKFGVSNYTLDECWNDYRLGLTWNVITNVNATASIDREAMDAEAATYGTTLTETFFGRLEAALIDLKVAALLD